MRASCTRRPRLVTALLSLATGLALVTAQAPSARAAGPDFTIDMDARDPIQVDVSPTGDLEYDISSMYWTPQVTADDVTITFTPDAGLRVGNPTHHYASVRKGSFHYEDLEVAANSPGFHTLTMTVSSPGHADATKTFPYVWAPGGPMIDGGGSLAGLHYAEVDAISGYYESDVRYSRWLGFVDGRWAYDSILRGGVPQKCGPRRHECVRYAYDPGTGLVQVGDRIGRVRDTKRGRVVDLDGSTNTDIYSEDDLYTTERNASRVGFLKAGKRLQGVWDYGYASSGYYPVGLAAQRLRLRRDGRFYLRWALDDSRKDRVRRGRYEIRDAGRIVFKLGHGHRLVGTLSVAKDAAGRPSAGKVGVWLAQTIVQGKHRTTDANLLAPLG